MTRTTDSSTRRKIVSAMARLLRKQGYAATGLNELVAASGTPKGSLYHYFPGGKDQVAEAAVMFAGALVRDTLVALRQTEASPGAIVHAYGTLLAGWMRKSGFYDGCPITTTLLEVAPRHAAITAVGRDAFASWEAVFAEALESAGVVPARAQELALAAIMMFEGALILARVKGASRPIEVATTEVALLFERACAEDAREK